LLPDDEGLGAGDTAAAPDESGEDAERRALGHRVAAREPYLGAVILPHAPQELGREARLAGARLSGDEHRARDRLVDALLEQTEQRGQLALAADERRRLAEQRPRPRLAIAEATDEEAALVAADVEPHVEQA